MFSVGDIAIINNHWSCLPDFQQAGNPQMSGVSARLRGFHGG